jgi:hypothetical protein
MRSLFSHASLTVSREPAKISGSVGSAYNFVSTVSFPVTTPAHYLFCCQRVHRDDEAVGLVYVSLFSRKEAVMGSFVCKLMNTVSCAVQKAPTTFCMFFAYFSLT